EGAGLVGEDALEVGAGVGSGSDSEPQEATAASRKAAVATERVPGNFVMAESIRSRREGPGGAVDGAPIAVPPRSPPAPIEPLKCDLRNIGDLPPVRHRAGAQPSPTARMR